MTMVCGAHALNGLDLPYDPKRKWSRGTVDGIDVVVLPLPYSNHDSLVRRATIFLEFAWRSTVVALREDYDLLFATSTPLTAGIPGICMKLFGGRRPFVFEVRDLWPELPRALGLKNPLALAAMSMLEWLSYRTSDACIGLSPGIVAGIKNRSSSRHRVTMIPNGSDLELFRPGERDQLRLPGIGPDHFVAAFTGAHGIANGLDAVLDAAILLRDARPDIKLVFIGDGREKPRLIERAKAERLDNCIFLPPIRKTALAETIGCLDCGLMILSNVPAFYYGTSPNKFFDYLAAGIPILNNYPGWVADLIQTHGCGRVTPPDSAPAFATALAEMADAKGQRREMGDRARKLAEERFSREALSKQFVSFLESFAHLHLP